MKNDKIYKVNNDIYVVYANENFLSLKEKIFNLLLNNNKIYFLIEFLTIEKIIELIENFNFDNVSFLIKINTDNKDFNFIKNLVEDFKNLPLEYYLYYENDKKNFEEVFNKVSELLLDDLKNETDTPIVIYPFVNICLRSIEDKNYDFLYEKDNKMKNFIENFNAIDMEELKKLLLNKKE